MLQNESEMFNVGLVSNVRYHNGDMQVLPGLPPKRDHRIRKGKLITSREETPPSSPCNDVKLKFSERLKALFKDGPTKAEGEDDPYTFSEPEPPSVKNLQSMTTNSSQMDVRNNINHWNKPDDVMSETMSRLQAKIARNKIIGKQRNKGSSAATAQRKQRDAAAAVAVAAAAAQWADQGLLDDISLIKPSEFSSTPTVNSKKETSTNSSPIPKPRHHRPQNNKINQENSKTSGDNILLSIPPRRRKPRPGSTSTSSLTKSSRHESLNKFLRSKQTLREYRSDLYPLGLEPSDSESSEIDDVDDIRSSAVFQQHWFSGWLEPGLCPDGHREGRLTQVRTELRRRLAQLCGTAQTSTFSESPINLMTSVAAAAKIKPGSTAKHLAPSKTRFLKSSFGQSRMFAKHHCIFQRGKPDACTASALPCTRHCARHIMYNVDQLIFEHCTAKFPDNTQCCVPVFDISHELPLCAEHTRKRPDFFGQDNYDKLTSEIKPKKPRKKAKPSAMTRPSKRGKKKRRLPANIPSHSLLPEPPSYGNLQPPSVTSTNTSLSPPSSAENGVSLEVNSDSLVPSHNLSNVFDQTMDISLSTTVVTPYIKQEAHTGVTCVNNSSSLINVVHTNEVHSEVILPSSNVEDIKQEVEEALEMATFDPVELAQQATRLLEEHDLTNVLNQIPADAFNDLFTEDKNGGYEPTREETEELERALEAVDKDVKSLEKLSQHHELLNTLLVDEQVLSLAQLPCEVFPTETTTVVAPNTPAAYHPNGAYTTPADALLAAAAAAAAAVSIQTQTDLSTSRS